MSVRGAVDGVFGRFVIGWAHDPDDDGHRVELELRLNGDLVGTATADLERGDLVMAKVGDGCHAFRFELADRLDPAREHQLAVRATREDVLLPLANDFAVELEPGQPGPEVLVSLPPETPPEAPPPPPPDGEAPAPPARSLLGAHGWLYELTDLARLEAMLGRRPLPEDQIALQRERLLDAYRRLAELGVHYLPAVVPAKMTLYPDHLPPELEPTLPERAVALVMASLRDYNGIELLDLWPALRDARARGELVPRTGAELTWTGAFYAYRALAKELAKRWPGIAPLPVETLRLGREVDVRQSLASRAPYTLVGGQEIPVVIGGDAALGGEPVDTEPELVTDGLRAGFVPVPAPLEDQLGPGGVRLEAPGAEVPGTAIVVHSGAGSRIANLVAEHFASTLIAGSGSVPYDAAQAQNAVLVVHLVDERELCAGPPAG